jgi:hypothetical protein
VSIRAVVLLRDVARSITCLRRLGSVTVGCVTRERQLSSTGTRAREVARLVDCCRLTAMTSSYRDGRRLICIGLVASAVLRPPRPVEHADEAGAGAAAALFGYRTLSMVDG